ncbi:MAG: hypothetical protein MJ113_04020 [Lachnospiraceae bacterium]|nr:hypothetical protein [Lachnospiraceae bacterium]
MKRIAYYFICFTFILFFTGCSAEKQTSANNKNSIEKPTSRNKKRKK